MANLYAKLVTLVQIHWPFYQQENNRKKITLVKEPQFHQNVTLALLAPSHRYIFEKIVLTSEYEFMR